MSDDSLSSEGERPDRAEEKTGSEDQALSRRRFLERTLCGAALAGAPALGGWRHMGPGVEPGYGEPGMRRRRKISKASARYQYRPRDGQRCGGCRHFLPPDSCEIVEGNISPHGWCRYYRSARRRGPPAGGGMGPPGGGY